MQIRDIVSKLSGKHMANKQSRKNDRYSRHPQQIVALGNLLNQFVDTLSTGYSDEAWTQAGRSYRRLAGYLFPNEREVLATAWRNCYVDNNVEAVRQAAEQVRTGL